METAFSDSWHRVAQTKTMLRPSVTARKQPFAGEIWYVLHDAFSNQFFRLKPETYQFIARLSLDKSVEMVWQEHLQKFPERTPGQDAVLRLLGQLDGANLLQHNSPSDAAKLSQRRLKQDKKKLKAKWTNLLFIRVPVFDPHHLLNRLQKPIEWLFGPLGLFLWVAVVGSALTVVADNAEALFNQAEGMLAPGNLALLYLSMAFIKTLHEFGHAALCRKYGGEVHTIGILFLVFTPLPYMDATASWGIRSRTKRALVGAGGMIVELFIAALATFVWANSAPGIIHGLAYNMMFIASVSTLLFNINPLLRFDGYYILSDLLSLPNLYGRAKTYLRYQTERLLFGLRHAENPAQTNREAVWFTIYGITSGIYRVFVVLAITLFVSDQFLIVGALLAASLFFAWGIRPPFKFIRYLFVDPRLARNRNRAILTTLAIAIPLITALLLWPAPNRFRAPGVVEALNYARVAAEVAGKIDQRHVQTGDPVVSGDPLITLTNPTLAFHIESAQAQLARIHALQHKASYLSTADLQPLEKKQRTLEQLIENLQRQQKSLIVRAPQTGVWVAPDFTSVIGSWINRGDELGSVVDPDTVRFVAVVPQEEATEIFQATIHQIAVRLNGEAQTTIPVSTHRIIPFQQDTLPSAALGWLGGGDVAVSVDDRSGVRAAEPFFRIVAQLDPLKDDIPFHGRSGQVRLTLTDTPLMYQWWRTVRQFVQQRYRL
ncbi:MAG: efflux RND transporter periplasmic adaptor subunit [Magnetococcales bacterium]|nr:efflux RND transporter periplasmic adaptor subunit [Magnetococcales bacterium]